VANGWIEGTTVASIILGVLLGGVLISGPISSALLAIDIPRIDTGVETPPQAAICVIMGAYAVAGLFNFYIPNTGVDHRTPSRNPFFLIREFGHCCALLWRDKLGQISLATTTLFWGAGGNLKYIVLAWASLALGYNTAQASSLTGVVAIGTAVGAIVASVRMRLDMATRVIPMGIAMGVLVIGMNFIGNIWLAVPFLILLGGLGGFLVVPMNALLQHRGHNLMGAGRSIAVQNFNEQACILVLGAFYSACTGIGLSAYSAITAFGVVVAGFMWLIKRWHQNNLRKYPEEVEHLLAIARSDKHH
jgi:hypothetical protein